MKILNRFQTFIKQHSLCSREDKILLTVSGGKDSVCMLHLFSESGYKFEIAHCNFQLRGEESDEEEKFVRQLAEKMHIPIHVKRFEVEKYKLDKGVSTQMACRELRYSWFDKLAEEADFTKIATAHHLNDQIETVFINLLRGTGVHGLQGIKSQRDLYIRPLLFASSQEIEQYLEFKNYAFRTDSSNLSSYYSRNKIRLEVVPKLKEIQPQLEEVWAQNLEHFKEVSDFLNQEVGKWKNIHLNHSDNRIHISLTALLDLKPLKLWVFEILKEFGVFNQMAKDIVQVLENLKSDSKNTISGKFFQTEDFMLSFDRGNLLISPLKKQSVFSQTVTWEEGMQEVALNQHVFHLDKVDEYDVKLMSRNNKNIYINCDALLFPLELRFWKEGDKFKPLGMKGKSQKLSDFFISRKIPNSDKTSIPLLVNNNQEIIWIVGMRQSENFKITEETLNIVRITHSILNDE